MELKEVLYCVSAELTYMWLCVCLCVISVNSGSVSGLKPTKTVRCWTKANMYVTHAQWRWNTVERGRGKIKKIKKASALSRMTQKGRRIIWINFCRVTNGPNIVAVLFVSVCGELCHFFSVLVCAVWFVNVFKESANAFWDFQMRTGICTESWAQGEVRRRYRAAAVLFLFSGEQAH